MNNILNVLATIASDATLTKPQSLKLFVTNAEISKHQKQAILMQNANLLADTIIDFPISMSSLILTPEDTEDEDNQQEGEAEEAKNLA
jgi:hypothetical protein